MVWVDCSYLLKLTVKKKGKAATIQLKTLLVHSLVIADELLVPTPLLYGFFMKTKLHSSKHLKQNCPKEN